ncbi:hypothetical protein KFE25_013513 [Diacronema lutheri]|uniref:Urease accessory protein UreH-like transmembrane domain-containing protein n=1 Tax=Diacronema lutheri TaxID=2081491 RepID=A0A8J5XZI6_DIALT|nr:hypothetical protein KFE25_013513 [Diacronema lutheri]
MAGRISWRAAAAALLVATARPACAAHAARLGARALVSRPLPVLRGAVAPALRSPRARRAESQLIISAQVLRASIGGSLAGGLHALTGPDHLACVLPICVGRRWWSAVYTGAYWGLGHGIGAMLVGALGYAVKGWLNLDALAQWGEVAVGLSILIIGILGLQETSQWRDGDPDVPPGMAAASAIASGEAISVAPPSHTSSLLTGVIHGCSGSGHLLGVLPALAMPSLRCAAAYLTMFGLGTMAAMSLFTAAVGEISVRMGQSLDRPDLPAKMTIYSSGIACVVGAVWTAKALSSLPRGSFAAALSATSRALGRLLSRA